MEKNLVIGEVIKPQGILGEVKVKPYTDDVSRFQSLKEVYVCGETYRVLNARIAQDAVYLSLSGVPDPERRRAAEGKVSGSEAGKRRAACRGALLYRGRSGFLPSDRDGRETGRDHGYPPSYVDLYTVTGEDGRTAVFPLLKDALLSVDIEKKEVVVSAKRFGEIAVYED